MLRLYTPIKHDIFKLQVMLKHLVCSVWCEADKNPCESKISADFITLYLTYDWIKLKVDEIYNLCCSISIVDKKKIKDAFISNNKIEELCNGTILPVYLNKLHPIVESKMKPLLVDFYEDLLERAKVPGTKKDYYEKLIEKNGFTDCPCCGLTYFEPEDSDNREAFDHYLPKAHYPFASVNFENLIPLCYKCNSDRKKAKDPIKKGKKAYYPFSIANHNIEIKIKVDYNQDLRSLKRKDLTVEFNGDKEKLETWNRLFAMNDRYNDTSRSILKTIIRKIKRRHQDYKNGNPTCSYEDSLDKLIKDYENDKYDDKKFLKIPLMKELKNCTYLIDVYA